MIILAIHKLPAAFHWSRQTEDIWKAKKIIYNLSQYLKLSTYGNKNGYYRFESLLRQWRSMDLIFRYKNAMTGAIFFSHKTKTRFYIYIQPQFIVGIKLKRSNWIRKNCFELCLFGIVDLEIKKPWRMRKWTEIFWTSCADLKQNLQNYFHFIAIATLFIYTGIT